MGGPMRTEVRAFARQVGTFGAQMLGDDIGARFASA